MKRCTACNNQFPDSYSTCPDCGKLLTKITEDDLAKENAERERLAEIKRQRMEAYRKNSHGSAAFATIGILCAAVDALMTALFFANSNLSGAALTLAGLALSVLGVLILKKPDMIAKLGSSKSQKQTEAEPDYRKLKSIGTVLVVLAVVCTAIQIASLASLFGEINAPLE